MITQPYVDSGDNQSFSSNTTSVWNLKLNIGKLAWEITLAETSLKY